MQQHIINRFHDRYIKDPDTGCWEWQAAKQGIGYGQFNDGKKHWLAHRFAAKIAGMDIKNKVVRHKCDNPGCVNPDHLETGTQTDNMKDREIKCRNGRKLTRQDVINIRAEFKPRVVTYKDLAMKYNVHPATIGSVVNNHIWRYA